MLTCTRRYDAVLSGLCYLVLHILYHSCAKLNLGVAHVYGCSHVSLSEILHASIHGELNNSHKRKATTTSHHHIETLRGFLSGYRTVFRLYHKGMTISPSV